MKGCKIFLNKLDKSLVECPKEKIHLYGMDTIQRENKQVQKKTTIPGVSKSEERSWYLFDFFSDLKEKEKILQYFLKNNIIKVALEKDDSLIIEDNNHQKKSALENDVDEIQLIKIYLQKQRKKSLLRKQLKKKTIGRIAPKIVEILRGKNRKDFFPNLDLGSFVVLLNTKYITFTGKKLDKKKYYNHSGYPGGLRKRTLREMLEKYPQELAFLIIKGMMPHTKLGNKQLKRLFIYPGSEYKQQAQKKKFIKIDL